MKIFKKPDLICLAFMPVVIILGLIAGRKTLDIQIHTTYYVFRYEYTSLLALSILTISSIFYWLIIKNKINFLTRLHLKLVIPSLTILMLIAALTGGTIEGNSIGMDMTDSYSFIVIILISIFAVTIGTLAILVNIFKSITGR